MFILRSLFWVCVALMLLPTERDPAKSGKLGTAAHVAPAKGQDGFCVQHAEICATGGKVMSSMQRKFDYAVRLVHEWTYADQSHRPLKRRHTAERDKAHAVRVAGAAGILTTGTVRPRLKPKRRARRKPSQNTLELFDMVPVWKGPKSLRRA